MSTTVRPSVLLDAVQEAADVAGRIALRYYRTSLEVMSKPDGSPVTIADREAEAAVRAWIERRFPNDGIEGEEHGVIRPDAARRWIVDPIDGTKTFVRGVPLWGTLVAVAQQDNVIAGAAFFPAVDEMLAAAQGEGSWWNGSRCTVSDIDRLERATVLTTDERFANDDGKRAGWHRLAARAAISRSWGDCYGYLLVATGRADVMVDPVMSPWDAAAFLPIVEEAGGVLTDWLGRRTAFGGSVVATNAALARETRALLQPSNPSTP